MSALSKQVGGGHYQRWPIQPIQFIVHNGIPFLEANVIKYVTRHQFKNGVEDIDKAIHYLELIKEFYYPESRLRPDARSDAGSAPDVNYSLSTEVNYD